MATTGGDANPGTRKEPFATITRARDAIRQLKKDGHFDAPVTVTVMEGTYHLAEPIFLGPGDSGAPDKPVTYQAAPGETVILSGGVPIGGAWTPTSLNGNQVFVTELTGATDQRARQVISIDDPARIDIDGVWSRNDGYLHDQNSKKETKSVTFRPELSDDGDYEVYLRWTQRDDAARRIPVDVRFDGGTQRYTVSQAVRGGWYKLGTHRFTADADGAVIVRNDDTEGIVMAEAVMFIKSDQPRPWVFRQLFEDEEMQTRARYPNTGHLYATGGGVDHMTMRPGEAKASWGDEPDAQVHIVAGPKFFNQLPTITSIGPMTGTINFEDECFVGIRNNNSFHVEGIKSELDAPGEWHLDAPAGRLYFKPKGELPGRVVAPRLNSIFRLIGDILNNHVHDGHGISRSHGKPARRNYAYGVYLDWYTSYSKVADNVIHDCSGGHGDSATRVFMGGEHNTLANNPPRGETREMGAGATASNRIPAARRVHAGCVINCFDEDRVTLKGKWQTVSKPGFSRLLTYFYKQSAAGAGAETSAVFHPPVPEEGHYDVFFFTVGDPDQATDAPVEISHADGVSQVTLDLSEDKVWVKKGNYRFRKGEGTITFTAKGASGPVAAHKIGLIRNDISPGP